MKTILQHGADINISDKYIYNNILDKNFLFFFIYIAKEDLDINIKGVIAKLFLSKGVNVMSNKT